MEELELVFVYGSLKRGGSNHRLLAAAFFKGEARAGGLQLYDLGPFPMAIAAPQPSSIEGELYAVTAETLQQLDLLEAVPRLYQRHRRALLDGRQAWIYLGRPRQVRFVPVLPAGRWPAPLAIQILGGMLLLGLCSISLRAETSLAACNRWHRSSGLTRLELGNQIGAASYLTKIHRLQQSPAEAPVELYADSDLERACESAR